MVEEIIIRRIRKKTGEEIARLLRQEKIPCNLVYDYFTVNLTIENRRIE